MSADRAGGLTPTRATLAEVAERAGVSVSTVSKVLNGRNGVSEDTRARVEALLADQQYNPRNPGPNHAPLIEVLCFEIDSSWASEALAAIEGVARRRGVGVVVSGTSDRQKPDAGWMEGVLNRRPVGVLLVASNLLAEQMQQLRSRNIPFVVLGPAGDVPADVPTIGSADWTGAYAAARHLVDLGHREVAVISGPGDMMAATARLSGYRAALEGAGLSLRPEHLRRGEFHHEDGIVQGRALLSLPEPPTAVLASSDVQALGVYEAARALGRRRPVAAVGDRLRRHQGRALGGSGADDRPRAHRRHGGAGRRARARGPGGPGAAPHPDRPGDDARGAGQHGPTATTTNETF